MCGIVGFCNTKDKNLSFLENKEKNTFIIDRMKNSLSRRGPDESGFFIDNNICFGHKRLIVVDPEGGKQPMRFNYNENSYVITYNGQLYNSEEIRNDLLSIGISFNGHSDTEVLLKAYAIYGSDILKKLNGIFAFAIWDKKNNKLFFARDHFGVKPFYYSIINDTFVFSSEIKGLFEFPGIDPIINQTSIQELFGIGPAHTPGISVFKNINELKPANFGVFDSTGIHIKSYWKFISKEHTDSLGQTCDKVKFLLEDSIKRQLVSDVPLCTFLSGGLDSSIITLYASNYYKEHNLGTLDTFSVDYIGNDKNFHKTDFQPNSDNFYIDLMVNKLNTNHRFIMLDTPELADTLEDAMIARDMPGMADVDSSLLLFCKNVKNFSTVALTGECADEIFGGYPWFFREDALDSDTFPWSIALSERQKLLNENISKKVNLNEYVNFRYHESLDEVPICDSDTENNIKYKKISYLTLNWFMQTLLDRSDRMAMYNGLELRVPFCDFRLAEYVWNIPWELKALNGREKGLLRYIMKDILPSQIVDRKKSPYPKTWNPTYTDVIKHMLTNIMNDKSSPINYLLNRNYILDILNTNGSAFTRPWFGQLMTGPQLMAYLCQVNMWLKKYNPKFEI